MSTRNCETHDTEIGRICQRAVVTIGPDADITAAAQLMRRAHVGFLIVCDEPDDRGQRVVGVLTDRDVVVAVIAHDADPHTLQVMDVMTRNPLIVSEDCPLDATLAFMRDAGVRRVPVVGSHERLVGVLSLDDVVEKLARQLNDIAGAFRREQRAERMSRP